MDLQAIFGDRPKAKPNQSAALGGGTAAPPQAAIPSPLASGRPSVRGRNQPPPLTQPSFRLAAVDPELSKKSN